MRFNTFDQVAGWYSNTKPLGGNQNKGFDIRPIGERRYKHCRIKKYDEDTYALLDGYFDPDFGNSSFPPEYMKGMAAVLWSRRDGKEYIRIRNLPVGWTNFARADFHQRYLPLTMSYRQHQSGKHDVRVVTPQGVVDYVLPKTTYHVGEHGVLQDDGALLEFERDGDKWVRVSAPCTVMSTRIDKERKKELKPAIEEFYKQMQALAPMLNVRTYNVRSEYAETFSDYLETRGRRVPSYWIIRKFYDVPSNIVREILSAPEHDMRVTMIALIASQVGLYKVMDGRTDIKDMRVAYNALMNRALGLTKTEEI